MEYLISVVFVLEGVQCFPNLTAPIIFPSDLERISNGSLVPNNRGNLPIILETDVASPPKKPFVTRDEPNCLGRTEETPFCIEDNEYDDIVRGAFDKSLRATKLSQYVFENIISPLVFDDSVATRNLLPVDTITETPACDAREHIIYPKRAKNTEDNWVFLLNHGKNLQAVRVETCVKEGVPCHLGSGSFSSETVCRQKYVYRRLLALDASGSSIQPESVLLPSCCVCYIRNSGLLRSAFLGLNFTLSSNPDGPDNSSTSDTALPIIDPKALNQTLPLTIPNS